MSDDALERPTLPSVSFASAVGAAPTPPLSGRKTIRDLQLPSEPSQPPPPLAAGCTAAAAASTARPAAHAARTAPRAPAAHPASTSATSASTLNDSLACAPRRLERGTYHDGERGGYVADDQQPLPPGRRTHRERPRSTVLPVHPAQRDGRSSLMARAPGTRQAGTPRRARRRRASRRTRRSRHLPSPGAAPRGTRARLPVVRFHAGSCPPLPASRVTTDRRTTPRAEKFLLIATDARSAAAAANPARVPEHRDAPSLNLQSPVPSGGRPRHHEAMFP